ncbi:MAG: glycosyltransferase family 9 protein [Candidatus Omnitrophica bacterium]|nr:glycosyltransferase family 9 protein [Candidatus Omnitrophota bacterium]MDD5352648.1 glycosyltransferase family 9 protein [Candidatus Omnitrophota bacterium]MDD5550247.1 glycosyltransferase family 9 protein [Candidatus Omnitrophota bacterium]
MKSRDKIILDRIIGRPLAFLLNSIVCPLGKILKIDHDDSPNKVKTIAIAKLLGMGSILRATPMVRALRQKYPSAKYILITTLKNKPLVERISLFDNYLYIRDSSFFNILFDTVRLIIKLWKLKIDLYFDLEVYSAFSTILTTLSLARNRYGFYKESTRFRIGLNTHLVWFNDYQHISRIYLQLARVCGIDDKDIGYKIEKIKLQEQDKQEVKNWLISNGVQDANVYIVVNPNASDLLLERRWPMDYFVLLINALAKDWQNPIFIIGSPEEYSYTNALYGKLSDQAKKITFNSAGKFSFEAVMELISNAKLMVTNDSGLYHIAVGLDINVVSLWGPGNPLHYADFASDRNIIFHSREVYCSPCIYRTDFPPCRGNNICMKSISPKEVYKKICEILSIKPTADISTMDYFYEKEKHAISDISHRNLLPEQSRI